MSKAKNVDVTNAEQLIVGIKKHFANAPSLTFANGTFTPAQIEASLQMIIDLRTGVDALRAAFRAKLAVETAQATSLRSQMAAFVAFVKATFGNSPDVLVDFGLKPRKPATPLTLEKKAEAAARRAATRKARNTMGKNQKKTVKGDVTGVVVTPLTAPKPGVSAPANPVTATPATLATSGAGSAPMPKSTA